MKRAHYIPPVLFVSALLMMAGCKAREAASNNAPPPASSNASSNAGSANNSGQAAPTTNANRSANPGNEAGAAANAKANAPAQLLGTYESREVQSEGVVTVMSQLKTLWMFSADGTYFRESQVKGKAYHADSGKFRIESPDKLHLSIEVTGLKTARKVQTPPLSKTHVFSLSPDGEELRLTSDKGSVGIFRRVAKAKTP